MIRVSDKRVLTAALLIAVAALLAATGCGGAEERDARRPDPRTSESSATGEAEYERRMTESWLRDRVRYTDARSAGKDLPFALKLPDPSLVESPVVIYVRKASKIAPAEAYVAFGPKLGEGVELIAVKTRSKQNFAALIAQDEADRASGAKRSDGQLRLIEINGAEALAIEPGVNYGAPRGNDERPGFVQWWDGDVHYIIYGTRGPDGTPLAELTEIAESLR